MKVQVGQTVYLRATYTNNHSSRKEIRKLVVEKVGRQYFYGENMKFDIETGSQISKFSASYHAHETEQEINYEQESESLQRQIKQTESLHLIPLENLRQIVKLLKP